MTSPHYDLGQQLDQLQRTVRSLSSDVDELRERHDTLDQQCDGHDDRIEDLDRSTGELREEYDEFKESVDDDVEELRAGLKQVASTVGWLERRVRAERDLTPVDLDVADEQIQRLAIRAQQGRQSKAALLTAAQRGRYEQNLAEFKSLNDHIERAGIEALQASAALASTGYGTPSHDQAAAEYRTAIRSLSNARARFASARDLADEARRALDHDDAQREVHGPNVMTGESAREILKGRLRERISAAVAAGELLPTWFTTVLGHQPPATGTDQWLRTATAVLRYRITYAVTDPVVALGPPYDGPDTDRQTWEKHLQKALREQRRWPS